MIAALAILSVPVAFLAGGVAFNAWRSGETGMAVKAFAVFAVACVIFIAAPKAKNVDMAGNCWTDWDGRANRTVCD